MQKYNYFLFPFVSSSFSSSSSVYPSICLSLNYLCLFVSGLRIRVPVHSCPCDYPLQYIHMGVFSVCIFACVCVCVRMLTLVHLRSLAFSWRDRRTLCSPRMCNINRARWAGPDEEGGGGGCVGGGRPERSSLSTATDSSQM